jgi:hypothetical protein
MSEVKHPDDFWEQVRPRNSGRHDGQGAGPGVPELGHAADRLRKDRFGAKDVIREKLPGGRQRAALLSALY